MLEFRFEWEEAAEIRSRATAATWARLEIRSNGKPVTEFWSEPTNTVRRAVYGSLLPLARCIARNWWSLLDEALVAPEVLRGARSAHAHHASWLRRHNLVLSREGMAYPDLSIYREEDRVAVRWVPDGPAATTPGRFLGEGATRVERSDAEAALASVVEGVLARTEGLDDDDLDELRQDWFAITSATTDERTLCGRLAALGLDPYDPDSTASVEELLGNDPLPDETVLRDLLAASSATRLRSDLKVVRKLAAELDNPGDTHPVERTAGPYDPLPYRAGYLRARELRRQLDLEPSGPVAKLDGVIKRILGRTEYGWIDIAEGASVEAVVQRNGVCGISGARRPGRARRFLQARALHHWLYATSHAAPRRLLTRGSDWQQAASRAFAAELLAPAAALRARVERGAGWDVTDELAREFDVSPSVIVHQLENHGLI